MKDRTGTTLSITESTSFWSLDAVVPETMRGASKRTVSLNS